MTSVPSFESARDHADEQLLRFPLRHLLDERLYLNRFEYYLVGTYPPLKAMEPIDESRVMEGAATTADAYFHIPFCAQRCTFCHFAKEINAAQDRVEQYIDTLLQEVALKTALLPVQPEIATGFVGGGTPSSLTPRQLSRFLGGLRRELRFRTDAEFTVELHPGMMQQPDAHDRLAAMIDGGTTRWVFGVQSMDPHILRALNRGHSEREVIELLMALQRRDLTNVSLDLMYGLPHQTLHTWYETLRTLLRLGVNKFNVAGLMFKETDPIARQYLRTPELFPNDVDRLRMFFMADHLFREAGLHMGPLLYYSRDPVHCEQILHKLDAVNPMLLGFGVSSFGYVGGTQYYNACDLSTYLENVATGHSAIWRGSYLDEDERMRRYVMFALRSTGVSRTAFTQQFGIDPLDRFSANFRTLEAEGLLQVSDSHLSLTEHGALCAEGAALLFASPAVAAQVANTNATINRRVSKLEQHDYSPIGRLPILGQSKEIVPCS